MSQQSPDAAPEGPPSSTLDEPVLLHRGSALEVVRWPLTERVRIRLDTHALTIERGTLLAMIRGGQRDMALPLVEIQTVAFASDGKAITVTAGGGREVTLNGDEAIRVGAMLWALGVPGRTTHASPDELLGGVGSRINQAVDTAGAIVVGPRGLAFAPSGLLQQLVGSAAIRLEGPEIGGASLESDDQLSVQAGSSRYRFRVEEAPALLQVLRKTMSRAEAEAHEQGETPLEAALGHLESRSTEDPPLPELGELLLAGRGVWTPDNRSAERVTILLGTESVLLVPDAPDRAAWSLHTGRVRRGDGPDEPFDSPLLRLSTRSQTTIVRTVEGAPFVREFWRAAAPHQYIIPGEDYDPEPWRGVVGPARFLRLIPEDLTEHVHRPAMLVQRDDGIGVVLPPEATWPWTQGEFLRAEVSRPRGVFRFAAQYLRMDESAAPPREAAGHLGTDRDAVLRTAVLMPGPLPPALLPPKRALLRLPTDEPVRVVVQSTPDSSDENVPGPGEKLRGRLADISASGCALQLRVPLPPGSEVLVIPGGQNRYQFRAEVMGLRSMPESVRLAPKLEYELGMRFMGLNESRLSWLQREVLRRQRKRLTSRAAAAAEGEDEDALPLLDRHYHA